MIPLEISLPVMEEEELIDTSLPPQSTNLSQIVIDPNPQPHSKSLLKKKRKHPDRVQLRSIEIKQSAPVKRARLGFQDEPEIPQVKKPKEVLVMDYNLRKSVKNERDSNFIYDRAIELRKEKVEVVNK